MNYHNPQGVGPAAPAILKPPKGSTGISSHGCVPGSWCLVSSCVPNRSFMPMRVGRTNQLYWHREGWEDGIGKQDRKTGGPWRKTSSLIGANWALESIQSIPVSSSLQWYQIHFYRVVLDTKKSKPACTVSPNWLFLRDHRVGT